MKQTFRRICDAGVIFIVIGARRNFLDTWNDNTACNNNVVGKMILFFPLSVSLSPFKYVLEIIAHLEFTFRQIEHGNHKYFVCMHVFGTMSICTVYSEFKQVIKISFMVNIVRYPHGPLTNVTITLFRIQKIIMRHMHFSIR